MFLVISRMEPLDAKIALQQHIYKYRGWKNWIRNLESYTGIK